MKIVKNKSNNQRGHMESYLGMIIFSLILSVTLALFPDLKLFLREWFISGGIILSFIKTAGSVLFLIFAIPFCGIVIGALIRSW
jgi:hypothetical protein